MNQEKTAGQRLREGWEWCVSQRDSSVLSRARLNSDARYCVWANQSTDGRKWKAARGKEIFPWEGASDARVPLVDLYVREDVAKLVTAARRMGTQVVGVGSEDAEFGNRLQSLVRWQKSTQMPEYWDEAELLAQYGLSGGAGMVKVFWWLERQMVREAVDLESLMMAAAQTAGGGDGANGANGGEPAMEGAAEGGGAGAAFDPMVLQQLILNEATESEAVDLLLGLFAERFEGATRQGMRKLVRALRTSGHGKVAVARTVCSRPRLKALQLNVDVFLPPEATEVGDEVFERELVNETTLRERVGTCGWDEAWVEEMVKSQKGVTSLVVGGSELRVGNPSATVGAWRSLDSRLFEVVHAYRRVINEEGVPEIRYTVFNSNLLREIEKGGSPRRAGVLRGRRSYPDGVASEYVEGESEFPAGAVAYDGPLGYEGIRSLGEMFVLWEREKHCRPVDGARGYGELAGTPQAMIKTEWDSRVDRNSMATLPPLLHKPGQEPERWGPGVRIPTMRRDDIGFAEAPNYDQGSKELEETVLGFTDRMFGRAREGVATPEGTVLGQHLVDRFLHAIGKVDAAMLKLDQQLLPEVFYYRVEGSLDVRPLRATREEIQGSFDVQVGYNVELLDPNTRKERLGLIEQWLNMDVNGIVDRDEAMRASAEMIDPNLGRRLLKRAEDASQHEIEDEKMVFAQMSSGVPVDVKPGQAYGLRLDVLNQILQNSPPAQKRYMQDEDFRAIVDGRMQQLGHQLEQRQNAQIGRLGAESGFDQFKK